MKNKGAVKKFFDAKHLWFSNHIAGKNTTANEFADWLEVPSGTYSMLSSGVRHPNDDNLHKIATKLGPEVYDLYDVPRLMPDDPAAKLIMKYWFSWPEEKRQRLADVAEQIDQEGKPTDNTVSVTS